MNAIAPLSIVEECADRRGRHLRNLAELGEIGMALARAVARQALAELDAAETQPPAAEQAVPDALNLRRSAEAGDAAARTGAPGGRASADLSLAFARLSRAVAQVHALEARIAAGEIGAPPRPPGATARDLGLRVIRQVMRGAAARLTDTEERVALYSDIHRRIEALRADPVDDRPVADILGSMCRWLNLELDPSSLPREVLDLLRAEAPDAGFLAEPQGHRSTGPDPP